MQMCPILTAKNVITEYINQLKQFLRVENQNFNTLEQ